MKTEQYCILSLIFLTLISGSMYYNTVLVDTQAYVPSVYYLQGKQLQDDDVERATQSYAFKRPVEIVAVALMEPLFGIRQSYSILNMLLFIGATIFTFYYTKKIFKNTEDASFIGYVTAILFATSLPVILYATRVLVDVAGYVTILVGLFAIDAVLQRQEKQQDLWYLHAAVWIMLGSFLLVRDAVIILFPYYMLQIVWRSYSREKQLGKTIIKTVQTAWPVIFVILPELLFMWYFDVGFLLTGKGAAITAGKYSMMGWLKFIIVHGAAFHIAYILAYVGWKQEQDNANSPLAGIPIAASCGALPARNMTSSRDYEIGSHQAGGYSTQFRNKERKTFYVLYGICAMTYLIGIQLVALTSPRFTMVVFPVLLPLAAVGILSLAEKWKNILSPHKTIICCILIYAIISFLGAWLYPSRTLIVEDAGGNAVINAVLEQIKLKLEGF